MAEVRVVASSELTPDELRGIRTLVEEAFGNDFGDDDWDHALGGVHVLVEEGAPVAHAAVVPRDVQVGTRVLRCGYVEAVATLPAARGRGHATRAMRTVAGILRSASELGVLSTGHHGFYERLGWERWQGPTFVIRDGGRVRTPDEDDGIMVLRSGASAEVSLGEPLACWARPGDDW